MKFSRNQKIGSIIVLAAILGFTLIRTYFGGK